jgi:ectoine hydroxylase-related dioxygenase (phytanoyl-CoA dioxygenase family)
MTNTIIDKAEELRQLGYCVLRNHFPTSLIDSCRSAFLPTLTAYLERNFHLPNRGPNRHFLPMPFERPCFAPEFFFDNEILALVKKLMGNRIVADQWGCDVPLPGSTYQAVHVDYQRPLFYEMPDLVLPPYIILVSFGLTRITRENGALELFPGTHKIPTEQGLKAVEDSKIEKHPVTIDMGDVLLRHPWTLHCGTPNQTDTPRPLVTIRYARDWYSDTSREVNSMPFKVWETLSPEQKSLLRFPVNSQ